MEYPTRLANFSKIVTDKSLFPFPGIGHLLGEFKAVCQAED